MSELPSTAVGLLKSTRFVHLATCVDNMPHVSLMNYTYYSDGQTHYVIISTPRATQKYHNIECNSNVSLLVHDWVTPKTDDKTHSSSRRNSLYELLTNLNKNEISRVSIMLSGNAEILHKSADEEKYTFIKTLHLNSNQDGKVFIEGEDDDIAIVLIRITGCKVTDTDNNVAEY